MKRWIWAMAAVSALGVAGCGTTTGAATRSGSGAGASKSTSAATGTSGPTGTSAPSGTSGSSSGSGTPSGTSGSAPAVTGATPECTSADLDASLSAPNGTAGSDYYRLLLTNNSSSSCFVQGYPGVSLVTSSGAQVGAAATRQANPSEPGTPQVVVAPGQSAASVLRIVDAGNYPQSSCQPTKAAGLRVYPPDQRSSLSVPSVQTGCAGASDKVLTVEPLHASSS